MKGQADREAEALNQQIQQQIKKIFGRHKAEVEKENKERGMGGHINKNDKSERVFRELTEAERELRNVENRIKGCEKMRRERRDLFGDKALRFSDTLISILRERNIKIKMNAEMEKLATQTKDTVQEVARAIRLYQKESTVLCGKSYDHKPTVERAFMNLAELGFLWENIPKFESIKNESSKETIVPAEYDSEAFREIGQQIQRLWPEPKIIKETVVAKPPPPPPPEIIQTKSELQLAHQLLFGFTRPQEVQRAREIYETEERKKNPDPSAINSLGTLYEEGRGVSRDLNKAFNYFRKSANLGDSQGMYKVGKYLEKGQLNFKKLFEGMYANRNEEIRGAIVYYEKAAAKGHLDALTDLGYIYEKGVVQQNGAEYYIEPHIDYAKKYYEKAKEKNFPRAYNNLGTLLITSNSPTNYNDHANLQKGLKYLQRAVQLSYPKAHINLGKCYLTGTGVDVNLEKARALFKEAAARGEIQGRLEYLRSYIGTQLEEDQIMTELVDYARMVLLEDRNNAEALYIMGVFEEKGIGKQPNKEASFHYMTAAARLEYSPALTRLGDYYYSGFYVQKNLQNARLLYEKAAEKGQSQAVLNLALMLDKGLLPQGSQIGGEAEELFKKAEGMGNVNASLMRGLRLTSKVSNPLVKQAAEKGSMQALKLLSHNQQSLIKATSHTGNDFKKMSTFYMKEANMPQRSSVRSTVRDSFD